MSYQSVLQVCYKWHGNEGICNFCTQHDISFLLIIYPFLTFKHTSKFQLYFHLTILQILSSLNLRGWVCVKQNFVIKVQRPDMIWIIW